MATIARTHDRLYLDENRYEKPKEIFRILGDRIQQADNYSPQISIGDIGCAAGELPYFLRRRFPQARVVGCDIMPELIEKAQQTVSGAEFILGSVTDPTTFGRASFDITCLFGVLGIFDDFKPCLENLIRWTRPDGRIFVFGQFNPEPVDVWVQYRKSDEHASDHREPGWNTFSIKSVSEYLDQRVGPRRYQFHEFELPFDLARHPTDPVRTYTLQTEHGRRLLVNGLQLISSQYLLEIHPSFVTASPAERSARRVSSPLRRAA